MCESSHCQWFFFSRIAPNRLSIPFRSDRPMLLTWNSRHMTSFADETGDHLLRSDFSTNNFRWIWLGFKDSPRGLLLCFGLIPTVPWFVTCDDLINDFWGTASIFQTFFYTNRHEPCLSVCQIVRNPRRNLFYDQLFMQHWMYAGGRNAFWEIGKALIKVSDDIRFELDQNNVTFLRLLHHSKAFDTINH